VQPIFPERGLKQALSLLKYSYTHVAQPIFPKRGLNSPIAELLPVRNLNTKTLAYWIDLLSAGLSSYTSALLYFEIMTISEPTRYTRYPKALR